MLMPGLLLGFALLAGQPDTDTVAWIERLGDPSWSVREAATETLSAVGIGGDEAARDAAILAALGREDLGEEVRLRLTRIAMIRFRSAELGGLGVSFGNSSEGGVQIQNVVRGFPAEGILQPGDVIVAINDQMIGGQEHLRAEILSRRPGERLPVLVRRDRTVLELDLPLGAYGNLEGAASLDDSMVLWAMRLRYARDGVVLGEPARVGSGLRAADWVDAAFAEGRTGRVAPGVERRGPGVVAGGSVLDRDAQGRRRGWWSTRGEAERSVQEQHRAELGRRMTAGVRTRSVLVEFERALAERIAAAREDGRDTEAAEARLGQVREQMRRLDELLTETARRMDETGR